MKRDKMSAGSKFLAEICLDWSKAKSEIADVWDLVFGGRENEHLHVYFKCQITRKSTINSQYNWCDPKIDGFQRNARHSWPANNCCEL